MTMREGLEWSAARWRWWGSETRLEDGFFSLSACAWKSSVILSIYWGSGWTETAGSWTPPSWKRERERFSLSRLPLRLPQSQRLLIYDAVEEKGRIFEEEEGGGGGGGGKRIERRFRRGSAILLLVSHPIYHSVSVRPNLLPGHTVMDLLSLSSFFNDNKLN